MVGLKNSFNYSASCMLLNVDTGYAFCSLDKEWKTKMGDSTCCDWLYPTCPHYNTHCTTLHEMVLRVSVFPLLFFAEMVKGRGKR